MLEETRCSDSSKVYHEWHRFQEQTGKTGSLRMMSAVRVFAEWKLEYFMMSVVSETGGTVIVFSAQSWTPLFGQKRAGSTQLSWLCAWKWKNCIWMHVVMIHHHIYAHLGVSTYSGDTVRLSAMLSSWRMMYLVLAMHLQDVKIVEINITGSCTAVCRGAGVIRVA